MSFIVSDSFSHELVISQSAPQMVDEGFIPCAASDVPLCDDCLTVEAVCASCYDYIEEAASSIVCLTVRAVQMARSLARRVIRLLSRIHQGGRMVLSHLRQLRL